MSGRAPPRRPPPWPSHCANLLQCLARHKGHIQLLVRAVIHFAHATLSAVLALQQIDRAHAGLIALFQLISSITLLIQCKNAADSMFVARALASFGGVGVWTHLAACGPVWIPVCDSSAWKHRDFRAFFRAMDIFAAIRLSLNGFSLLAQYAAPLKRTSPSRGHAELLRRSYIRAVGIPIQCTRAVLKLVLPQKTRFNRSYVDIGVNFARAMVLIPIDAWSLRRQWMTPPTSLSTCCAAGMKDQWAEELQLKEQSCAAIELRDQSTMQSGLCQTSEVSTQTVIDTTSRCAGTIAASADAECELANTLGLERT